jgi:hypothetical protein
MRRNNGNIKEKIWICVVLCGWSQDQGGRVSFSTGVANPTRVEQEEPKDKNIRFTLKSLRKRKHFCTLNSYLVCKNTTKLDIGAYYMEELRNAYLFVVENFETNWET